jgi:hypothetical protein
VGGGCRPIGWPRGRMRGDDGIGEVDRKEGKVDSDSMGRLVERLRRRGRDRDVMLDEETTRLGRS